MTDNEKNDEFVNQMENPNVAQRQQMMDELNEKHQEELAKKKNTQSQNNPNKFNDEMDNLLVKELPDGIEEPPSEYPFVNMEEAIDKEIKEREEKILRTKKVEEESGVTEEKPKTKKKETKKKKVDIISPEYAEQIKDKKNQAESKPTVKNTIDDFDDLDKKVEIANTEVIQNSDSYDEAEEMTVEKINKTIDKTFRQ